MGGEYLWLDCPLGGRYLWVMDLSKICVVREIEGDIDTLNDRLGEGWQLLAIKTERISGNPNEFKDHHTYLIGLPVDDDFDRDDDDDDGEEELETPPGNPPVEAPATPPAEGKAPNLDQDVPF